MQAKNNSVPNQPIILLNPKDDLPPDGAPISDDDISECDSFFEITNLESEGYLFEDVAPAAPQSPCPVQSEEPNIAPEGAPVLKNISTEGDNASPEGDKSRSPVWKREKERNSRLKRLKLNRELYALTCGRKYQPPMSKKLYQKRKRMKYRQYRS